MEILITSKTHKGKAACVGGLILKDNRMVRLLNPGNWDQYGDTDLNVGDIWDIQFTDRKDVEPPHIEDIIIQDKKYLRNIGDISQHLLNCGVTIYSGSPTNIFNGRLGWTGSGSGYVSGTINLPANSVGFWISDKDLTLESDGEHYKYPASRLYPKGKQFKYVGFETAIPVISSGTLMRISLARWWKQPDKDIEERCYLQLSGWY